MNELVKYFSIYLPYKVKIEILDWKCDYVNKQYDEIVGLHQRDNSGKLWSVITKGGAKPSLDRIKLLLKPLSDLIKEIEIKGEKITPIDELNCLAEELGSNWYMYDDEAEEIDWIYQPAFIIDQLLEWHFDIYGLIEKGFAVEINKINNYE